ncbi:hypothetical protein H072_8546 [Dactylellina haptotyla CBS 200.50]|uniref:Uncharacterized protein n=1 Tax=Dactylellina haptotyla (strain CBS 200.50) TaxID=1284197 RepID=S8A997_DACHA|nr:hypothetical protein H072_8546 [Dactylellina haptotyla CBS 200.50]
MARDRRKHEKGTGSGSRRNVDPAPRTPDKPTASRQASSSSFPTPAATPNGPPNRDTHQDPSPVNFRASSEESVGFYQPDQFHHTPQYSDSKPRDQDEEKLYLDVSTIQVYIKATALKLF